MIFFLMYLILNVGMEVLEGSSRNTLADLK